MKFCWSYCYLTLEISLSLSLPLSFEKLPFISADDGQKYARVSNKVIFFLVPMQILAWRLPLAVNMMLLERLSMTFTPNGRGIQRQFSENICSEDDLRSRIFGKFVVKFLACLPLLGFRTSEKWYNCPFLTDFYPKKVT